MAKKKTPPAQPHWIPQSIGKATAFGSRLGRDTLIGGLGMVAIIIALWNQYPAWLVVTVAICTFFGWPIMCLASVHIDLFRVSKEIQQQKATDGDRLVDKAKRAAPRLKKLR